MNAPPPRDFLLSLFRTAVAAADPAIVVPAWLPPAPRGRTIVIGAGKASASMARAFDAAWEHPLEGVIVTRYGYAVPCPRVRVMEASHPVPDEAGLAATGALFEAVSGLTEDDLVVALISGGGSALLPSPPAGLSLADEQAFTRALLHSGLGIGDMNLLRKHVSGIKGGRLAQAAFPARLVTLVLSDIPGDDPALVASGPTIPDRGSRADALRLLARTGLALPEPILHHLHSEAANAPHPSDPCFANQTSHVIGSAARSLEAAAAVCAEQGIPARILSDAIEGEARDIGRMHAALAREIARRGRPFPRPVVLLSGGETTVTVGPRFGKGGRNSELALAFAIDVQGYNNIHLLAADTDGIDGESESAGAFADGNSMGRFRQAGIDARTMLAAHDSWTAFQNVGDHLTTGPTQTNLNDFRAILITRPVSLQQVWCVRYSGRK